MLHRMRIKFRDVKFRGRELSMRSRERALPLLYLPTRRLRPCSVRSNAAIEDSCQQEEPLMTQPSPPSLHSQSFMFHAHLELVLKDKISHTQTHTRTHTLSHTRGSTIRLAFPRIISLLSFRMSIWRLADIE